MRLKGLSQISVAISLGAASIVAGPATAWAAPQKLIPPPPRYYVLDEPHLLNPQATRALQALLIEHDRATGEQIVVAIFNSLDGEDLNDFTNRVFQKWEIGQREKDNGVLLAIYNQDRKARIEVGYGLEPTLTDAKSSRILRDYLIPGMKAGQPAEAVTQSALQILQTIDSPLVQNGRAQQILRSGGMLRTDIRSSAAPMKNGWIVWLVLGLILMTIVSHIISSAEAHFTRAGWYRPRPWRRRWWDDDGFGGPRSGGRGGFFGGWGSGGGGGWGGGGGYSGGGGRSGGGGASAGW